MRIGRRRLRILALVLLLGGVGSALSAATPEQDGSITLFVRSTALRYEHQALLEMASEQLMSLRGDHQKPAIPLEALLARDAGLSADAIVQILVFRTEGMPVILRGAALAHLSGLLLVGGGNKLGEPHPWALAARDEATYQALVEELGSRRKHNVYRIDITPKRPEE